MNKWYVSEMQDNGSDKVTCMCVLGEQILIRGEWGSELALHDGISRASLGQLFRSIPWCSGIRGFGMARLKTTCQLSTIWRGIALGTCAKAYLR